MRSLVFIAHLMAILPHTRCAEIEVTMDGLDQDLAEYRAPQHPIIDAAALAASPNSAAYKRATERMLRAMLPANNGSGVMYLQNCGLLCNVMAPVVWDAEFDSQLNDFFASGRHHLEALAGINGSTRGFIRKGSESGVKASFYEVKEGFEYGMNSNTSNNNKWGGSDGRTVEKLVRIFDEMQRLKNLVVEHVLAPYLNARTNLPGHGVKLLSREDWEVRSCKLQSDKLRKHVLGL